MYNYRLLIALVSANMVRFGQGLLSKQRLAQLLYGNWEFPRLEERVNDEETP